LNFFTKNLFKDIFPKNEKLGNFDGGFGFDKFDESHGALTFCSICSFFFFQGKKQVENTNPSLENWFYNKIKPFEFFFIGRISKIPDSCYFYWLGAISIICNFFFPIEFLNSLIYCKTRKYGGLSDQPSKIPDLYHTSYSLCGLSFYIFYKKTKKYREEMGEKFFYYLQLPKINPIMGIKESRSLLSLI
jgi:protein farnesyltransferase subunit beta